MDESQNHYAGQKKAHAKYYMLYDSIYIILENANDSILTKTIQWLPRAEGREKDGLTAQRKLLE